MLTIERLRSADPVLCQRPTTNSLEMSSRPSSTMIGAADIFESHRPRLFRIAYRMLRTRADAEDVVQDAYVRWHETTEDDIQSPVGFLITVTTRLCLDRLRQAKKEREEYMTSWLPEATVEDYLPSPEERCEVAEEVSSAFLAVLERLGSDERAAFLLRDIFDYDYPEVARIVGKSEAACRQLIHRARTRLRDPHARFAITPECRERVLGKFIAAIVTKDRQAVLALLAEEVEYVSDGAAPAITAATSAARRRPAGTDRGNNLKHSTCAVSIANVAARPQAGLRQQLQSRAAA